MAKKQTKIEFPKEFLGKTMNGIDFYDILIENNPRLRIRADDFKMNSPLYHCKIKKQYGRIIVAYASTAVWSLHHVKINSVSPLIFETDGRKFYVYLN